MKDIDEIDGSESSFPPRVYRAWIAIGLLGTVLATVVWMAAGMPSLLPSAATPETIATVESLSGAPAANATDTVSLETSAADDTTTSASAEATGVFFDATAVAVANPIASDDQAPPAGATPYAPPVVPVAPPPASPEPTVTPQPSAEPTATVTPPSPDPPNDWLPGFGRGKGHGWGHFK